MNQHTNFSAPRFAVMALLALTLVGCKSTVPATDDASLNSAVQTLLSSDPNLTGQTIQASVAKGVVTLSGSVTSDTVRSIASGDAGQVPGIKTVIDNLVVQAPPLAPAVAAAPAHTPPTVQTAKPRKPSAMVAKNIPPPPVPPAPIVREAPPAPAPPPAVAQAPPAPPPAPPQPVEHKLTLDAGFTIPVRITETLDSASTQTGDKFTGAIAADIIVEGIVALPQGTPVTGHVDAAQDAAHFKGSSLLTISLSAINRKGEHIDVTTDPFTKQGEGRGKNTAEKVGGGAAVGAILGGILGGGKGAAIGAAAGGGVGAGANGVTRGQQVQIPSETVVRFKLSDPIVVRVATPPAASGADSGPTLERHPSQ